MSDTGVLSEPELVDAVIEVIDHVTSGQYTALLEPDVPALSAGIVDSLAMAELIEALRDRFGVRLALEDLTYDTADSPRQIAALVISHAA
jgi:acyl carrier protein